MDINILFEKWIELTRVDPQAKEQVITDENRRVFEFNNLIEDTVKNGGPMDGAVMLKYCFEDHLKDKSFTLSDIINNDSEYKIAYEQASTMRELLNDEEITGYIESFRADMEKIIDSYQIPVDSISDQNMFMIYMNAKEAVSDLDRAQFKKGKRSKQDPKYIQQIRAYDNINDLLLAVATNACFDGITLNAVIDRQEISYSYFCFIIKDGENIYMLSDMPKSNFARKFSGRAQGRMMERRICKYMFPYELLNLSLSKTTAQIDTTALSDGADNPVVGSIKTSSAESALWTACCITMLYDEFFGEMVKEYESVYSGGMVSSTEKGKEPGTELVVAGSSYGLSLGGQFDLIEAKTLTADDAINGEIEYEESDRNHHNDWLLERYKDKIDESSFNLYGDIGITDVEYSGTSIKACIFDSNTIGTKEQIEQRRLYIARMNMSAQIEYLYKTEVKNSLNALEDWYMEKLLQRKDFFEKVVATGECMLTSYEYSKIKDEYIDGYYNGDKITYEAINSFHTTFKQKRVENCLKIITDEIHLPNKTTLCSGKTWSSPRSFFVCGPISYDYKIKVNCPEAIAEIAGVDINELPELLKHYTPMNNVGNGNPIITHLDPVEFIRNFISDFHADIHIAVSKSEVRMFKKKHGEEK